MSQRSKQVNKSQQQPRNTSDSEAEAEEEVASEHSLRKRNTINGNKNSKARTSQMSASQRSLPPSTSRATQNLLHESEELSQPTQRTNLAELSPEVESHLVGGVLRYLLVADRAKTMIPRTNIIKAALPNHSKYYKHIMGKAKTALSEVFGYNLVELEGSKYILINNLENYDSHLQFSENDKAEHVLLFIVLGHIFMTTESGCTEEELFNLLKALKIIDDDNYKHDYFGDVKYLLTEKFVKQGYLDLVTISKPDPLIQHYQWGVRAKYELDRGDVLDFMSKIFDNRLLSAWFTK